MSGPGAQRWRVTFRRDGAARGLPSREACALLEAGLSASGLPLLMTDGAMPRPRLVSGPPVAPPLVADEELFEFYLAIRRTRYEVRTALERIMPADHAVLDLDDVWVGAPSLSASLVAADYRVALGSDVDRQTLTGAVAALLSAARIERERDRGGRVSTYDLRELIDDIRVVPVSDGAALEMRLRIDQQRGLGRPDEVLAALHDLTGVAFRPILPIVRGRLHLSSA
jgi:radical SAM-linked protein